MKINYQWLQEYIEEPLPPAPIIAEKIIFGAFEVENFSDIVAGSTSILDIKTLPDRNHDCLGHYGIAREIAGLFGLTLKPLHYATYPSIESDIKVHVQTPVVRRYLARKIFNVAVKPSPEWLVDRLHSIGARSINNVVDATNYVMYTLGQPIHAFDYDRIGNGHITVRQAVAGEQITTLDGVLVPLDERITVITNNNHNEALAIAGVKGGAVAKVDETTKTLILEVATFDPAAVRKAAQQVNIHNDSSKRFENEISTHIAPDAMRMVTDLIVQLAGGVPEDVIDEYPYSEPVRVINFSASAINLKLGIHLSTDQINALLLKYGYSFEQVGDEYSLVIPHHRIDITGTHDIVEEIGRAYGYEHIEPVLPVITSATQSDNEYFKVVSVRNHLIAQGYSEIQTYSFTKKGDYEVVRGPVGKSALRRNLTDGMQKAYELNRDHVELLPNHSLCAFEIGSVFTKEGERVHVAWCTEKGSITELSLDNYIAEHQVLVTTSHTTTPYSDVLFKPWSNYPAMIRDVALWVPTDITADSVVTIIRAHAGVHLVSGPRLFDTFTKDNRTSLAFRLVFQSFERTLTEEEISPVMSAIYEALGAEGFEIR